MGKMSRKQKEVLLLVSKGKSLEVQGLPSVEIQGRFLALKALRRKGLVQGKGDQLDLTESGVERAARIVEGRRVSPPPKVGGKKGVDTEPDWSRVCENCGASPVVPATGMCGPCTFGEASTAGGNW